ncbi:DUF4122 family protein [Bacteroides reticulotermitis]|uniref:Conjugative transposon protein TraD n=2 Tax=Bacteroides reticulotermitis TaxID=1133319 RepID=W4UWM2_9BACE|nr:DUF4122 family protein [Bacteroides reticulotermitis]MBB4045764.1 hypothetical protein [Bacteroides reticulotermitis]GAE84904.1 conjugative transposon protein TraD [Bacteroides reticulotermitis JCM 10512]
MEEIVYLSVRLACVFYILYKVWGTKKKVREICDLLYVKTPPVRTDKKESETILPEAADESGVMGGTRFVYLDENAGKTAAPYMSQPLDTGYIGEDEDIPEEDVECQLPLEEMKILKEEQEDLDVTSPEVDPVSGAVTPADLDNAGNVLFKLDHADQDEEKSRRAALTLYAIRETDLFEIFSSQVENKNVIENLMGKYLDGEGNALPVRKTMAGTFPSDEWKQYL